MGEEFPPLSLEEMNRRTLGNEVKSLYSRLFPEKAKAMYRSTPLHPDTLLKNLRPKRAKSDSDSRINPKNKVPLSEKVRLKKGQLKKPDGDFLGDLMKGEMTKLEQKKSQSKTQSLKSPSLDFADQLVQDELQKRRTKNLSTGRGKNLNANTNASRNPTPLASFSLRGRGGAKGMRGRSLAGNRARKSATTHGNQPKNSRPMFFVQHVASIHKASIVPRKSRQAFVNKVTQLCLSFHPKMPHEQLGEKILAMEKSIYDNSKHKMTYVSHCANTLGTLRVEKSVEAILPKKKQTVKKSVYDEYLMTHDEFIQNHYPLKEKLQEGYKMAPSRPQESSTPRMFGVDCEMCITCEGPELTRVTFVDEDHNVIYDELIVPKNKILDYNTKYSGITKETLKDVTKTLEDVYKDIFSLMSRETILVGHSLENDLHALKMVHFRVIDSAIAYMVRPPRPKKPYKVSLKKLALRYLNSTIQSSTKGHDSAEDAIAALQLVQRKLKLLKKPKKENRQNKKKNSASLPTPVGSMPATTTLDNFSLRSTSESSSASITSESSSASITSETASVPISSELKAATIFTSPSSSILASPTKSPEHIPNLNNFYSSDSMTSNSSTQAQDKLDSSSSATASQSGLSASELLSQCITIGNAMDIPPTAPETETESEKQSLWGSSSSSRVANTSAFALASSSSLSPAVSASPSISSLTHGILGFGGESIFSVLQNEDSDRTETESSDCDGEPIEYDLAQVPPTPLLESHSPAPGESSEISSSSTIPSSSTNSATNKRKTKIKQEPNFNATLAPNPTTGTTAISIPQNSDSGSDGDVDGDSSDSDDDGLTIDSEYSDDEPIRKESAEAPSGDGNDEGHSQTLSAGESKKDEKKKKKKKFKKKKKLKKMKKAKKKKRKQEDPEGEIQNCDIPKKSKKKPKKKSKKKKTKSPRKKKPQHKLVKKRKPQIGPRDTNAVSSSSDADEPIVSKKFVTKRRKLDSRSRTRSPKPKLKQKQSKSSKLGKRRKIDSRSRSRSPPKLDKRRKLDSWPRSQSPPKSKNNYGYQKAEDCSVLVKSLVESWVKEELSKAYQAFDITKSQYDEILKKATLKVVSSQKAWSVSDANNLNAKKPRIIGFVQKYIETKKSEN